MKERFEKVDSQSTMLTTTEIWVDRATGVNYLWHTTSQAGGLTPLLDANGKVIVTDKSEL